MDQELRTKLCALAVEYQGRLGGCHGIDHTLRVVNNAALLAKPYAEVDADLLETAAWLHDIGRGVERASGVSHATTSAKVAEQLLPELGFSADDTILVCDAIADHRYSSGRIPKTWEGKLLQDADRLDALGAIGIARTFTAGEKRLLYHLTDPFGHDRQLDDVRYTLDHFYTKLLHVPKTLHTPEARKMAERRVHFLRQFLDEFAEELGQHCAP